MSARLKIILIGCVGLAVFFSLYKLTESPPLWYDEGIYDQIAMNSALGLGHVIQVAPHEFISTAFVTGGYPFLEPIAWSMEAFGIGVLESRLVMVLFILATLLAFFTLISKLFGRTNAVSALALLVTFPVIYGDGKNVLGEVPGLLYLSLFLLSVHQVERHNFEGVMPYITAGVFGGLCLSTKPIFFLLGGAVVVAAIILRRSIIFKWKALGWGLVAFIVPMVIWFTLQFQATDSASHVLQYYANPYGISNLTAEMMTNFLRFFHESSPLYFAAMMLVWLFSVYARKKMGRSISLVETITVSFAILVSVAYLRTAGWYRYFFVAEVPALAFLPMAIASSLEYLKTKWKWLGSSRAPWLTIIVVLLVMIQSYQLLFTSWVAVHNSSTITADVTAFFAKLPQNTTVYLYNVPELALFVPGQRYYQYLAPTDSLKFGSDTFSVIGSGTPDMLITADRLGPELAAHAGLYPATSTFDGYIIFSHKK